MKREHAITQNTKKSLLSRDTNTIPHHSHMVTKYSRAQTMDAYWVTGIELTADALAAVSAAEHVVNWRFAEFAAGSCRGIPQELGRSRACSMCTGARSMPACARTPTKLAGLVECGRRLHQLGPCRAIAATPRSLQQYPRNTGVERHARESWVLLAVVRCSALMYGKRITSRGYLVCEASWKTVEVLADATSRRTNENCRTSRISVLLCS